MNPYLTFVDYAALSPLLVVLSGVLVLLLLESFADAQAKTYSWIVALAVLVFALIAVFLAPQSSNPLLSLWILSDHLARTFNFLFILTGIGTVLLSHTYFQKFDASRGEFYFLLLSSIFGLILIGSAADFLTLFLGLETLSISLYVLTAYMKDGELSSEAALKYFLTGAAASAFLLYGIALIYGAVGTTSFQGLGEVFLSVTSRSDQALFYGGISFVTLGFCFKAAIFPFHAWAPDVYDGASTPVTAFMAVGTKMGAFAAFARVFLVALPQFDQIWNEGMAWLAIATMVYANTVALRQVQMRRFFAYSSISHAGFLLMPLIAGTPDAISALLYYLVVYAVATLGAFSILSYVESDKKGAFMKDLQGLFRRSPFAAAVLALCLMTLAGIPPTAGFFAKFYLFKIAFEAGYQLLVIAALLTTILSAFYYFRIISIMFTHPTRETVHVSRSWSSAFVEVFSFASIMISSCFPEALVVLLS